MILEIGALDEVQSTDITVTLARKEKPIKLLKQLSANYEVNEKRKGIYRIKGLLFPLQIYE